jgi:plastocyanin
LVAVLAAVAALVVAVSAFATGTTQSATPQRVSVGMTEFKFTLAPKTVKKNVVTTFALTNRGTIGHDFKVGGKKSAIVAAGKKGTLKVTFKKAGRYPYLCTLPSHAAAGMKGVLIVK